MKFRSMMLGVVLAAAGLVTLGCERREPAPAGGQQAQPPGETEPAPNGTTDGAAGVGTGSGTDSGTGTGTTP